jgi:transposase
VCCVRVPSPGTAGKRRQEVQTCQTMTRSLLVLADRLGELGVTRVVMEATGQYWKPVVRHEAPCVRAEVKGLRLRPVAAGR